MMALATRGGNRKRSITITIIFYGNYRIRSSVAGQGGKRGAADFYADASQGYSRKTASFLCGFRKPFAEIRKREFFRITDGQI
jgi:hypothetical protein